MAVRLADQSLPAVAAVCLAQFARHRQPQPRSAPLVFARVDDQQGIGHTHAALVDPRSRHPAAIVLPTAAVDWTAADRTSNSLRRAASLGFLPVFALSTGDTRFLPPVSLAQSGRIVPSQGAGNVPAGNPSPGSDHQEQEGSGDQEYDQRGEHSQPLQGFKLLQHGLSLFAQRDDRGFRPWPIGHRRCRRQQAHTHVGGSKRVYQINWLRGSRPLAAECFWAHSANGPSIVSGN